MREVADDEKGGERGSFGVREAKEGEKNQEVGSGQPRRRHNSKENGEGEKSNGRVSWEVSAHHPRAGERLEDQRGTKTTGKKYGNHADGTETAKVTRLQTPRFTAAGNLFAVGI